MSTETRRLVVAWAPAALYMAVIWIVSSIEQPALPIHLFPFRDKGVHAIEYAVLAFLLAHACLRTWEDLPRARVAFVAVMLTVLWGFLDELHQAFVPGRSADLIDLFADTLGAAAGVAFRFSMSTLAGRRGRGAMTT